MMAAALAQMKLPHDMTGKTLLDIRYNVGWVCLDAERRGAVRMVGIDVRADVMSAPGETSSLAAVNPGHQHEPTRNAIRR